MPPAAAAAAQQQRKPADGRQRCDPEGDQERQPRPGAKVNAAGQEGGNLDVSLSGPFQGEGKAQLPELDLTAKANGSFNGQDINFDGGLTLLSDHAFVNYQGTEYEVDPTTFSFVKSAIERSQQSGAAQGQSAGATACQEAVADLKVGDFVDNLSNEGSSDVGGTATTHVSGDLNVPGAIEALLELTKEPGVQRPAQRRRPAPLRSRARQGQEPGAERR